MTLKKSLFFSLSTAFLFVVSCAIMPYAREVKKKPSEGGVIALKTYHSDEDRAKADLLMKTNCGNKEVKVLEEGEVVVGNRTEASSSQTYNPYGSTNNGVTLGGITFGSSSPSRDTNVASETTQIKEWQISYECVTAKAETTAAVPAKAKTKKNR